MHSPFRVLLILGSGLSELDIHKHLSLEEEKDDVASTAIDSCGDFTETKYLLYGLDLEEQR